ncbi:LacI family DNA-binding transcriptional regulator [Agrilactobacillus fermenti]|uniref:LacI family DNA-binding transcriptional regulator n=1 Tax=Agrilactobacillus fermenti TaxID=2586909 RepID=UPI003A5C6259
MTNIAEIAKRAGVGTTTVSRYLNNRPYVSAEKKQRIEQAIKALDYTPSAIATQLRVQATKNIGVLVSRITNPFFTALFDALERSLHEYGYQVMVMQTYDDAQAEARFLDKLKSQQLDGVILASVEDVSAIRRIAEDYPGRIVLLNEAVRIPGVQSIILDHRQATLMGLNYLAQQGHPQIAYVTGGSFYKSSHGADRNEAYRAYLKQRRLPLNKKWIFEHQHTVSDGQQLAQALIAQPKEVWPDAYFTNSDEVALGMIAELLKHHIKVPKDIAIMGYDDQPLAAYLPVPLTTIRQPIKAMAEVAVVDLLQGLKQKVHPVAVEPQLKLIVRQSA